MAANALAILAQVGVAKDPFAVLRAELVALDILAHLDVCYALARLPDGTFARQNMANPGTYDAAVSGAPVFARGRGYSFGANNTLDTGWNPATQGVNYTLNDASHALYSLTTAQSSASSDHGNANARMQVRNASNQIGGGRINDGTADTPSGVTDGTGFTMMQRRSSTDKRIFKNGVQIGSFSRASTAITSGNVFIGGSSNIGGSSREIAFDAWGSSLTGKEAAFSAAVTKYVNAMAGNTALPTNFSIWEGDVFSINLQEVLQAASYAIVAGQDGALFTLAGNLLSLPAQDFAAPADANTDNIYVVTIQANPVSGDPTFFNILVTQKDLNVGAAVHRYILPAAAGAGDGTSWANAGTIAKMDQFIGEVGPGGFVNVGTQNGDYTPPHLFLTKGGAKTANVTVRGVDVSLSPSMAVLKGTRTVWTLPVNPEQVTSVSGWSVGGGGVISLQGGANNITFDHLRFEHCGNVFVTEASVYGVTLQNFEWLNVQRFWEQSVGITPWGTTIKNGTGVGFSKQAFRFRGAAHDILMQDVTANSGRQNGDNFAVGVQMDETAHDLTFTRCIMNNCHDEVNAFWNGDGFSSEHGNYNLTFTDCEAHGHTDAGFDLKGVVGRNFTHTRSVATDNKNNFKCWGNANGPAGSGNFVLDGVTSTQPHLRGGTGAPNHIDGANGAAVVVKGASSFTDIAPHVGGAIYVMENTAGAYHVATDTVESSVKPRTSFFAGTTIDTVIP